MKPPALILIILVLAALIAACAIYPAGNQVTTMPAPATLVIRNAKIYDPVDGWIGSAVAARGDKIVIIGNEAAVRPYIQNTTRILDAGGGLVLPGLQDAHGHLLNLGFDLEIVDLRGGRSEAEMASRVAEYAKSHPEGWLLGRSWDQNLWENKQFPTRASLDAVTERRPALMTRVDGHAVLANSSAMILAGVTRNTPEPAGGKIMKDSAGEPTGVFIDEAISLVSRVVPARSNADRERAMLHAQKEALAAGLVCVHDAGLSAADQSMLESLDNRGLLKLRIYGMAAAAAMPRAAHRGNRYELRAVKAYADGALGSRGAAMLAPYSDDPGNTGLFISTPEELHAVAADCAARNLQLCTHAIGDRGNRMVLDVYESILKNRPDLADARWRVEHCQVVAHGDFERFQQLKLIASMQPTHATSDGPWAPARVGAQRMEGAYAWRRFLNLRIPLAFGSDFPVESHDPRFGIFTSLTRRAPERPDDAPFGPGEPLTMKETLAAFTTGAAWASFHESDRGRIQAGYAADFTIFNTDFINNNDPKAVLQSRVIWTIVGGAVAFPEQPAAVSR